jgi:hypothetical protein
VHSASPSNLPQFWTSPNEPNPRKACLRFVAVEELGADTLETIQGQTVRTEGTEVMDGVRFHQPLLSK